jgi:hypothetical protein
MDNKSSRLSSTSGSSSTTRIILPSNSLLSRISNLLEFPDIQDPGATATGLFFFAVIQAENIH